MGSLAEDLDLSVIPMKHSYWHTWALYAAHAILWTGFWIAAFHAWSGGDWGSLATHMMLLGIGLGIFRGVAYFMNVWVMWSQYVSLREIREEAEIKEAGAETA